MMDSPMLAVAAMPTAPLTAQVLRVVMVKPVRNSKFVTTARPMLAVAAMPIARMPVRVLPAAMVRLVPN